MLLPVLARDDRERRLMINTIGPVWDGNEVWLLTAGGATFAAFPEWYATLFSGFYLPLLLILLALIVRGVAFEYRHQRPEAAWHSWWDRAIIVGSYVPGVPVGRGVRQHRARRADRRDQGLHRHASSRCSTRSGCSAALVTLLLFLTHGAMFLALKTDGDIRHRARALAVKLGLAAAVARRGRSWSGPRSITGDAGSAVLFVVAALALVGGIAMAYAGREGWALHRHLRLHRARGRRPLRRAVPRRDAVDAPTRRSR